MDAQTVLALAKQSRAYASANVSLVFLLDFAGRVAAAEREACAKLCDVTPPYPFRPSIEAAHAIRLRAQSTPQPPAPPADHP